MVPKRVKAFNQLGIYNIEDLLFYFPHKHIDRGTVLKISDVLRIVRTGLDEEITVVVNVVRKEELKVRRGNIMKVVFEDETGNIEAVWFNKVNYFRNLFTAGDLIALSGKPVITRYGHLQIVHPNFDRLSKKESDEFLNTGKIIPFYKITNNMLKVNLGNFTIRKIMQNVVT